MDYDTLFSLVYLALTLFVLQLLTLCIICILGQESMHSRYGSVKIFSTMKTLQEIDRKARIFQVPVGIGRLPMNIMMVVLRKINGKRIPE